MPNLEIAEKQGIIDKSLEEKMLQSLTVILKY